MSRNIESIFGAVVTAPHQIPFTYTATGGEQSISLPFFPLTGFITINGGVQVPVDNYEIDGNTINLGRTLEADDVVYCLFDKIISPEDHNNAVRIYKFQAVGGETQFTPDFTSHGVQALYIGGKYQVPDTDYSYDPQTGKVTLTTALTADVWVVAEMSVRQNYAALASNGGAGLVGTSSGETVQTEINNLRQEITESDSNLREDLSDTTGAAMIGVTGGGTLQAAITRLNAKTYTPEDFGCNVSAADNTTAVNNALTSGENIFWDPTKTYKVQGFIVADVRAHECCTGVMNLQTTRYNLGVVTLNFSDKVHESDPIRGMYVESAYDLAEFMYIKSLGINTILHYGNFNHPNTVGVDGGGSPQKVLDNAHAAGMRVFLNTEVGEINISRVDFLQKYRYHPALFAWSTFDEAMSRGISYNDQKAQYDLIRTYSNKPISLVDAWYDVDVLSNKILDYYDIILADPYPQLRSGTLQERIQGDLTYMRRCFGVMKAHSRTKNIMPVVNYTVSNGSPGATDVAQIIGSAEGFRLSGNGQFICFIWDGLGDPGAITSAIRGNSAFVGAVKSTAEKHYPVEYKTEAILFGGTNVSGHRPLNNIIDRLVQKDPNTTDTFAGVNAYPVHLFGGAASNTDRGIVDAGWDISGIGFKGTTARLVTDIPIRKQLILYGEYNTTLSSVEGAITLMGTFDGGYSLNTRGTFNISGTNDTLVNMQITTPDPNERLVIQTTAVIDSNLTRRFLRGVIVSTDW